MDSKNVINNDRDSIKSEDGTAEKQPTRPNESTGIYVRNFVKISDPESGQVFVETAN